MFNILLLLGVILYFCVVSEQKLFPRTQNEVMNANTLKSLSVVSKIVTACIFTEIISKRAVSDEGKMILSQVASKLPGYGPPDVIYPVYFQGKWNVEQTVSSVSASKRSAVLNWKYLERMKELSTQNHSIVYEASFSRSPVGVVSDRGATRRSLYSKLFNSPWISEFDIQNPNILVMRNLDGYMEDYRVTKRSIEDSSTPMTFGYSEFTRIAATLLEGIQSSIPKVFATRQLIRFRAREKQIEANNAIQVMEGVNRIESVERLYIYVNDENSFQPVPDAEPSFVVKSSSIFTRIV